MTLGMTERRSKSCKEFTMCKRREGQMTVSEAFRRLVSNAFCEGRLVAGITETASVLQIVPASNIMFCVLENKDDGDIQMMLLEAFCTEHKIKLIKVDNFQNIYSGETCGIDILTSKNKCDCDETGKPTCRPAPTGNNLTYKGSENVTADGTSPHTCLLLKQPAEISSEEEFVLAFYETYRYCKNAYPILRTSGR